MTLEINLLPRQTPYQKYRSLIFIGIVFAVFTLVVSAFLYSFSLNSQIEKTKKELDRVRGDNTVLKAERAVSKELRLYYDIKNEVHNLREDEQDYAKILDGIASKLSTKTEVFAALMNTEKQQLELEIHAESIDVIADFAALIRMEPWVSEVFVDRIRNSNSNTSEEFITKVIIQLESAQVAKEKTANGDHSAR